MAYITGNICYMTENGIFFFFFFCSATASKLYNKSGDSLADPAMGGALLIETAVVKSEKNAFNVDYLNTQKSRDNMCSK